MPDNPQPGKKTGNAGPAGNTKELFGIRLTSVERVLFPQQGLTKGALAEYYRDVAERMVPLVENRPLSLVRCPQGRARQCFFQKHDSGGFPAALKVTRLKERSGKSGDYFHLTDAAGLIAGVQMGVLEFHVWGSRIDRPERPDRLAFDLDPDEGLGFSAVKKAATDLRTILSGLELESWVMVTGGKGVHVVCPLIRRADWADVRAFAKGVAEKMAADEPDRFVATMSKARRKGRIFIDWFRNQYGSTAIAPYSSRARKGAPVAMPIRWDELAKMKAANLFSVTDAARRMRQPDPWADMAEANQSITAARLKAIR
ncbi:MAG TPA: non-homologous end-joining DNA ligase [Afifellaceae bacterium]|nr:non-homologous end-joining DNA ligase [Afifellaceae bacterium]